MSTTFELTQEQLEKLLMDALISSDAAATIRKDAKEAFEQAMRGRYGSDGVVKRVVADVVETETRKLLMTDEYRAKVREALVSHLTDDVLEEMLDRTWEALRNR